MKRRTNRTHHLHSFITTLFFLGAVCLGAVIIAAIAAAQPLQAAAPRDSLSPTGVQPQPTATPTENPLPLTNVVQVVAGSGHTCAVTDSGGVQCWGHNFLGQLGDGMASFSKALPVAVNGLDREVSAIAVGLWHTCALIDDTLRGGGRVHCWGRNLDGQLGDGTAISHSQPLTVSGLIT